LPKDKTPCDKGWNRFIVGKIEKFFDPNNSENKCCYQEDKNGPKFYIRSQNTIESDSTDGCGSEYILPSHGNILLAHVNLRTIPRALSPRKFIKNSLTFDI